MPSLSAQTVALQEAKEELNKLRENGEKVEAPLMEKVVELSSYYGRWNDLSGRPEDQVCWQNSVSQVLETLPIDILHGHRKPPTQHDPNANGSG